MCPFCQAQVRIQVQRLVGAASVGPRSSPAEGTRRVPHSSISVETLAAPAVEDKISGAPRPAPRPPPVAEGPPRLRWLFFRSADFFARLERGRPSVGPWVGGLALAWAGTVQGLTLAWWQPRLLSLTEGLLLGLGAAFALPLFLVGVYGLGLGVLGAPSVEVHRRQRVIGYGCVPFFLAMVPIGGLFAAVGTAAAAHARGLEHHLGLTAAAARALVAFTWALYAATALVAYQGVYGG